MRPDVIFLSYEEPNAEENYARLLSFAPHAKRVHHVKGIYHAWAAAAGLAETPRFFIVDGDSWILDGFKFEIPEELRATDVRMWRSLNAVNGLRLMNGCVKLVNRGAVLSMDKDALDFVVSMKGQVGVSDQVASETRFNVSPFLAWRCGFRECAKYEAQMVKHPDIPRIIEIWQSVGAEKPFGKWCMLGARMGGKFGRRHRGTEAMRQIHDMDRMKQAFEKVARRVEEGMPLPS